MFPARLLPPALGARSAAGASALELRLRHAHHLLGDAVCFLLIRVARLTHGEFCLEHQPGRQSISIGHCRPGRYLLRIGYCANRLRRFYDLTGGGRLAAVLPGFVWHLLCVYVHAITLLVVSHKDPPFIVYRKALFSLYFL